MAATVKQLAARRRLHKFSRQVVADEMQCSSHWVRFIEAGAVEGATERKWRDSYELALNALVEKKKAETR